MLNAKSGKKDANEKVHDESGSDNQRHKRKASSATMVTGFALLSVLGLVTLVSVPATYGVNIGLWSFLAASSPAVTQASIIVVKGLDIPMNTVSVNATWGNLVPDHVATNQTQIKLTFDKSNIRQPLSLVLTSQKGDKLLDLIARPVATGYRADTIYVSPTLGISNPNIVTIDETVNTVAFKSQTVPPIPPKTSVLASADGLPTNAQVANNGTIIVNQVIVDPNRLMKLNVTVQHIGSIFLNALLLQGTMQVFAGVDGNFSTAQVTAIPRLSQIESVILAPITNVHTEKVLQQDSVQVTVQRGGTGVVTTSATSHSTTSSSSTVVPSGITSLDLMRYGLVAAAIVSWGIAGAKKKPPAFAAGGILLALAVLI